MTDTAESAWNIRSRECGFGSSIYRSREARIICQFSNRTVFQAQRAAFTAVQQCQKTFADRRWNCSSSSLPFVAQKGYRETAYLQALVAASLAATIARSCTSGTLRGLCSCEQFHQKSVSEASWALKTNNISVARANIGRWKWGTCNNNIAYALRFSKQFADRLENPTAKSRRASRVAKMALYNYALGRKVVEEMSSSEAHCKCNGLTGTCSIKTCWPKVPKKKQIEAKIFDMYDKALKTRYYWKRPRAPLSPKQLRKLPKEGQLVYDRRSPDYCKTTLSKGLLGTRGRPCERDKRGPGGCLYMCCGKGFRKRRIREEKCRCRFQWCCRIKCDRCKTVERRVDICN